MNDKISRWIAPESASKASNIHFRCEKSFELAAVPDFARCKIAAESYYILTVNGRVAGRGPARGSTRINFYDTIDLAPYLKKGENHISVLVQCMMMVSWCAAPVEPAVRVEIENITGSDATWETYLCPDEYPADVPLFTGLAGYGDWHDLCYEDQKIAVRTVEIPASSPLFEKKLVASGTPVPEEKANYPVDLPVVALVPAADLSDREVANLSTKEAHLPAPQDLAAKLHALTLGGFNDVTLPVPPENEGWTIVFDFAKEVSGRIEFDLTAGEGTIADFAYEEELWQGDRLRADHTHTNPTYKFAERNFLRSGRQCVGNRLQDRGFRMVQLTLRNLTAPVTLHRVQAIDRRYPLVPRGDFFSSNYKLNRLWEMAKETISACTTDVFTDCPWRERLFYSNDLAVENRSALEIFGDARLHRHALMMSLAERGSDGLIPSVSPSLRKVNAISTDKTDFSIILSGDLTLPMVVYDYYLYTGDAETVREYYGELKSILELFTSWLNADGIIVPPKRYWNFFDWSYEMNGSFFSGQPTSLLNYIYIISLQALAKLAPVAGEKPFRDEKQIETLLQQTFKAFFDEKQQKLIESTDGGVDAETLKILGVPPIPPRRRGISRLPHALAILAGAGTGPDECFVKAMLDDKLLTPDLFYWFFIFQSMTKLGLCDEIKKNIDRYWGENIDSGSPTLWEAAVHTAGKAAFGGSASLCHGFSTAPVDFMQRVMLGISPIKPGFAEFSFAPHHCGEKFARGRIGTPHGTIRAQWHYQAESGYKATLIVPAGCLAHTPCGDLGAGTHQLAWK